jgi:hypothetical protein
LLDPHGEEARQRRLRTMLRIAGRTMLPAVAAAGLSSFETPLARLLRMRMEADPLCGPGVLGMQAFLGLASPETPSS